MIINYLNIKFHYRKPKEIAHSIILLTKIQRCLRIKTILTEWLTKMKQLALIAVSFWFISRSRRTRIENQSVKIIWCSLIKTMKKKKFHHLREPRIVYATALKRIKKLLRIQVAQECWAVIAAIKSQLAWVNEKLEVRKRIKWAIIYISGKLKAIKT